MDYLKPGGTQGGLRIDAEVGKELCGLVRSGLVNAESGYGYKI